MSTCCDCGRGNFGGVHTSHDGYGVRKKIGLEEYPWIFCCWDCWPKSEQRVINTRSEQEIKDRMNELGLCGFEEAWVGPCMNQNPCGKHINQVCWKCGAPATSNCSHAISLVCGVPQCDEHPHDSAHARLTP